MERGRPGCIVRQSSFFSEEIPVTSTTSFHPLDLAYASPGSVDPSIRRRGLGPLRHATERFDRVCVGLSWLTFGLLLALIVWVAFRIQVEPSSPWYLRLSEWLVVSGYLSLLSACLSLGVVVLSLSVIRRRGEAGDRLVTSALLAFMLGIAWCAAAICDLLLI